MTSLGVVIPLYNQRAEIGATLDALDAAIASSPFAAEIVVVDDGSTDGSADAVRQWRGATPARVVEQPNRGRFVARKLGINAVDGEYCLLIDSRVLVEEGALAYVASQIPDRDVWNAHVNIETSGNPFGVFWDVLTRRAFAAYFREPRTLSFGLQEFERYPKGTTCFFAPRELLAEAFASFRTGYRDVRHANDDTPVIRWIAARRRINLSPSFSCTYAARSRLRSFVRHAFHRGIVFVDGHGRRESRWFPIVLAFFPLTVTWIVVCFLVPALVVAPFVLAALGGAAIAVAEHRPRDVTTMLWVTPLYAAAHGLGMWRGLTLALGARLRRDVA